MSESPYGSRIDDAELLALIDACAEDRATTAQWAELNARLAQDRAALEFFVAHRHLQAKLSKSARAAATAEQQPLLATPAALLPPPRWGLLGAPLRFISEPLRFGIFFASVTCASLMLFFAQIKMQSPPARHPDAASPFAETPLPRVQIARIARAIDCRWGEDRPSSAVLTGGQQLDLLEGKLELGFEGGARLWVQGPSRLQLVSASRVRLLHGAVFAHISDRARGFVLSTRHAEVIDLGTEFGVEVMEDERIEIAVFTGRVVVESPSTETRREIAAGEMVAVDRHWQWSRLPDSRQTALLHKLAPRNFSDRSGPNFTGPIWLGNLFDDPQDASLEEAMQTDTFRATPKSHALGVDRAIYGGDSIQEIAPQCKFDFQKLGWDSTFLADATNDAWTEYARDQLNNAGPQRSLMGGIRTQGKSLGRKEPKIEEGVGLHSNAVLTFDLDEIRQAGGLQDQALEFLADRVGVNDDAFGTVGTVHTLVLLVDDQGVASAYLNGTPTPAVEQFGVWSIPNPKAPPLRADGKFASFQVPISSKIKFLVLAATAAHDGYAGDHAVWSGARLQRVDSR